MHAGCAAQGFCSIPDQSHPHRACSLTLPHTRMAAGYTKAMPKQGPKLPWQGICLLHSPQWGAITADTANKCQSKLLNNKSTEKHIGVTHIAVCKPPRTPCVLQTLSHSANCLSWYCSPSSVQGIVWSLIELGVLVEH